MKIFPDESIQTCVTSPPYWGLRDYLVDGQLGLEKTPEEYVKNMVEVFREVKRVLKKDGTLWLNLGSSYNGSGGAGGDYSKGGLKEGQPKYKGRNVDTFKPKDMVPIPWMVAMALQADGWWLRQDIIWSKPNPMPESVTDRCCKAHEYIFLLSKSAKYYYDNEAIKEPFADKRMGDPGGGGQYAVDAFSLLGIQRGLSKGEWNADGKITGRNKRSVWTIEDHNTLLAWLMEEHPKIADNYLNENKKDVWTVTTKPFKKAHFATFPPKLIEPCILAGCPKGGIVLDPFSGAGTTAFVSAENNRNYIGIELNQDYIDIAEQRTNNAEPQLF